MTIECALCDDEIWCLWYNDEWVCKHCFLHYYNESNDEWNRLNREAKEKRMKKRMQEFDDDYVHI